MSVERRGVRVKRTTRSVIVNESSLALVGQLAISTDGHAFYLFDDSGDPVPVVPAIEDLDTLGTVDSANDQLLIRDDSTGSVLKATVDSIVSAAVAGTDLSIANKTATTLDVASSTGTDATIPQATTSAAGLLTGSDKTKLDGIATGATANSSDATLLSRANHTGTQTASTISDFDTEVSNNTSVTANTAKVSADGSINTHSDVDVTTTTPSTDDLLVYDGSNWVPFSMAYACFRGGVGTTAIGATAKELALTSTTDTTGTGDFTLSGNEVTFESATARRYLIIYNVNFNDSSGGAGSVDAYLEIFNTSSWSELAGTRSSAPLTGNGDPSSASGTIIRLFPENYRLRIMAVRSSGSSTAIYQENSDTHISILRLPS